MWYILDKCTQQCENNSIKWTYTESMLRYCFCKISLQKGDLEDRQIITNIHIDNIFNSASNKYGKLLLVDVLKYLDYYYPNIKITLYDTSTTKIRYRYISLWMITLIRRAEMSWYCQFGFEPDIEYADIYQKYSKVIKSVKVCDIKRIEREKSSKYPWLSKIIKYFPVDDEMLVTDFIKKSEIISLAVANGLDDYRFNKFLKDEFSIEKYDSVWTRLPKR